jgi:hypothetical protein
MTSIRLWLVKRLVEAEMRERGQLGGASVMEAVRQAVASVNGGDLSETETDSRLLQMVYPLGPGLGAKGEPGMTDYELAQALVPDLDSRLLQAREGVRNEIIRRATATRYGGWQPYRHLNRSDGVP